MPRQPRPQTAGDPKESLRVLRGILFDMFGTLAYENPSRTEQGYHATHALLRESGIDISYDTFLSRWCAVMDRLDVQSAQTGLAYSMERVASEFLTDLRRPPNERLTAQLVTSYVREWATGVRAIPGVPELLAELAPRFRLGVVSNTANAQLVHDELKHSDIQHYFPVVVTSVEHAFASPTL